MNGTLNFSVISGASLDVTKSNGGIYCIVNVGEESVMTAVQKNPEQPIFESEFNKKLRLQYSDNLLVHIMSIVKDAEYEVGHISVPLEKALSTGIAQTQWLDVVPSNTRLPNAKGIHGKLQVKLHWIPDSKDLLDKSVLSLLGQRHKLLRCGYHYGFVKDSYFFARSLPVVSLIAPIFETTVEGTLKLAAKVTGVEVDDQDSKGATPGHNLTQEERQKELSCFVHMPVEGMNSLNEGPEGESKKATICILNNRVERVIDSIDSSIDVAKDSVLCVAKRTKDRVKFYVLDRKDTAVEMIYNVQDSTADQLNFAKEYFSNSSIGKLGYKGYEKLQPWVQPLPLVGQFFKPLEEKELAADTPVFLDTTTKRHSPMLSNQETRK